jgi:Tol biopolymer transport system component/tRNA A-37 threonylcarbamoyl transferase component Bud32
LEEAGNVTIEVGQQLLHYRLIEKIGEGGMGVVWKAVDTILDREVAIKILPDSFAEHPERLARFEREAKLLASLNHPSIAGIYGLHAAEGLRFLAMEFVPGEDLAERLARGPLPVDQAVAVARQILDALEAAHEQGVIHRDLKPANVQVTRSGNVKVLDFGLAKALDSDADSKASHPALSPTVTSVGSAAGIILGSASYMSPEQARGQLLDRRTDLWSFGAVLYELLSGRRVIEGQTISDTIAAVLTREIDWTALPDETPSAVRRLLRRTLVRDMTRRLRDAGDARLELAETDEEAPVATPGNPRAIGRTIVVSTLLVLAGVVAGYFLHGERVSGDDASTGSVSRMVKVTSEPGAEIFSSLSPDGKMLLYSSAAGGNEDVFLLRIGGQNAINLTQNWDGQDTQATFSRDGSQIAFRSSRDGGGVFVMGATGESVRRVTDRGFNPTWSPDGQRLAYSTESVMLPYARSGISELWIVELSSGRMQQIQAHDPVQPSWSPHGHRIAYWALTPGGGRRDILTVGVDGGEPVRVTDGPALDWSPVWSPDGRYLYFSSDRAGSMNLWRVPIDERSGQTLGDPQPVTIGASAARQWASLSGDGKYLAYVEYAQSSSIQGADLDPLSLTAGNLKAVTEGSLPAERPNLSPDDEWIAFNTTGVQEDIYVIRTNGQERRQLTNDVFKDRQPRWSPDGKTLVFYSNRSGSYEIWTIRADGSQLRQLTDTPGVSMIHPVWSFDGTRIACHNNTGSEAFVLTLSEEGTLQTTETLPRWEDGDVFNSFSWSSDGRLLAGVGATEDGVWVYSLEDQRYQRLTESGSAPQWMRDGRRLLYIDDGRLRAFDRQTGRQQEVLSLLAPAFVQRPIALSSDDRTVYFARSADQADVWMLELD